MREAGAGATARSSQILRGVLDACLLAVIGEGDAYGYAMTRRLAEHGLEQVGEGSIYPVLGRLEQQGLIFGERRSSDRGGPPRKYYRLNDDGRRALSRWTAEWLDARSAIDRVLGTQEESDVSRPDKDMPSHLAPAGRAE